MRLIYNTPNNNFDIVKVVSVNCRDLKFNNTEFNQLVETLNLISSVEKKKKFQSYFHSTFFFQTFSKHLHHNVNQEPKRKLALELVIISHNFIKDAKYTRSLPIFIRRN